MTRDVDDVLSGIWGEDPPTLAEPDGCEVGLRRDDKPRLESRIRHVGHEYRGERDNEGEIEQCPPGDTPPALGLFQ